MQNRKFRINILDIAIIAAVICVAAIIIFRAEISELIGSPDIATVQLQLDAEEVPAETAKTLKSGETVLLTVEGEPDDLSALITEERKRCGWSSHLKYKATAGSARSIPRAAQSSYTAISTKLCGITARLNSLFLNAGIRTKPYGNRYYRQKKHTLFL